MARNARPLETPERNFSTPHDDANDNDHIKNGIPFMFLEKSIRLSVNISSGSAHEKKKKKTPPVPDNR